MILNYFWLTKKMVSYFSACDYITVQWRKVTNGYLWGQDWDCSFLICLLMSPGQDYVSRLPSFVKRIKSEMLLKTLHIRLLISSQCISLEINNLLPNAWDMFGEELNQRSCQSFIKGKRKMEYSKCWKELLQIYVHFWSLIFDEENIVHNNSRMYLT